MAGRRLTPGVREGTAASVQSARRGRRTGLERAGVVTSVDALNRVAMVVADATSDEVGAEIACPTTIFAGDRVMLRFEQPHGLKVVGRLGGDFDPWHILDEQDEPSFNGVWGHRTTAPAADYPGTAAPGLVRFRAVGLFTVLAGHAERASGSVQTMFRLPPDYCPENDLVMQASNFLTASTGLVIRRDGDLESPSSGDIVLDGIMFPRYRNELG